MVAPPAHSIDGERGYFVLALVMRLLAILPGCYCVCFLQRQAWVSQGRLFLVGLQFLAVDFCHDSAGTVDATKTECGTWGGWTNGSQEHKMGIKMWLPQLPQLCGSRHEASSPGETLDAWSLRNTVSHRSFPLLP